MRSLPKQVMALSVVALGAIAGTLAQEKPSTDHSRADRFLRRYATALVAVLDHSPRKLSAADAVYASLDGMVAMLDPHTTFFRPDSWASMKERQQGSFHGIGVVISLRGGKVTVISPIEGTPAARLGLRAGDIIDAIEGQSTDGLDLDDVARRLRGPEGTTVKITISRPGLPEPLELTIERAKVPTDSVRYAVMLDPQTAYMRISDFTRTTGDEFDKRLTELTSGGATRLLLDLRDNPGGIVDSAVQVAGSLLDPGQQVFSTRGRTADSFQDYRTAAGGPHFHGPLVILINRGSASASEIVAGAMQDHDRGLLVGERSFGKGVVQTLFPVRDAGLALTTAKYYTPSGRCIQRDFESFFSYIHPDDEGATPTPPPATDQTVYHTDGGRSVYGGGGIAPDREVREGELSERVARLLGNSAFFHFAVAFLADKSDKAAAARSFAVDAETLARFRTMVVDKKWLSQADIDAALADPKDSRYIAVGLQTEVLNAGVSLSEGYRASLAVDDQVQAALKLFDQAAALEATVAAAKSSSPAAPNP